jgi:anti-sigma regulatory factor (Ser/Thr protein kinase)
MTVHRMEQVRYRRFRPAVRSARLRARELAKEWGLTEVADSLESAVSELVANAVVHGRAARGSRVSVTYRLEDRGLRVEVRDWATGMPKLGRAPAPDPAPDWVPAWVPDPEPAPDPASGPISAWDDVEAESGRGLRMVAALTDRWGVVPRVIGKSVWFELRVAVPPVRPASTMPAGPPEPPAAPIPSAPPLPPEVPPPWNALRRAVRSTGLPLPGCCQRARRVRAFTPAAPTATRPAEHA